MERMILPLLPYWSEFGTARRSRGSRPLKAMIKDENVTVYAKDDDCESDEDMDIPAHLMSKASASDDE